MIVFFFFPLQLLREQHAEMRHLSRQILATSGQCLDTDSSPMVTAYSFSASDSSTERGSRHCCHIFLSKKTSRMKNKIELS